MASNSIAVLSIVLVLFYACIVTSEDLLMGTIVNNELAYSERVSLSSVPLKTRTKNVFYTSNHTIPRNIKGIMATDIDNSKSKVTVTAGGVGFSHVNVRLKSPRGSGLNYIVDIYV